MNPLAIDFGTKNIGLAYAINGIIFTLPSINNNDSTFSQLQKIIKEYSINYIYIGVSEGRVAKLTLAFVEKLQTMLDFPIETVEEAVSTIEAQEILNSNNKSRKVHEKSIDSASAAVILRRVIS